MTFPQTCTHRKLDPCGGWCSDCVEQELAAMQDQAAEAIEQAGGGQTPEDVWMASVLAVLSSSSPQMAQLGRQQLGLDLAEFAMSTADRVQEGFQERFLKDDVPAGEEEPYVRRSST